MRKHRTDVSDRLLFSNVEFVVLGQIKDGNGMIPKRNGFRKIGGFMRITAKIELAAASLCDAEEAQDRLAIDLSHIGGIELDSATACGGFGKKARDLLIRDAGERFVVCLRSGVIDQSACDMRNPNLVHGKVGIQKFVKPPYPLLCTVCGIEKLFLGNGKILHVQMGCGNDDKIKRIVTRRGQTDRAVHIHIGLTTEEKGNVIRLRKITVLGNVVKVLRLVPSRRPRDSIVPIVVGQTDTGNTARTRIFYDVHGRLRRILGAGRQIGMNMTVVINCITHCCYLA